MMCHISENIQVRYYFEYSYGLLLKQFLFLYIERNYGVKTCSLWLMESLSEKHFVEKCKEKEKKFLSKSISDSNFSTKTHATTSKRAGSELHETVTNDSSQNAKFLNQIKSNLTDECSVKDMREMLFDWLISGATHSKGRKYVKKMTKKYQLLSKEDMKAQLSDFTTSSTREPHKPSATVVSSDKLDKPEPTVSNVPIDQEASDLQEVNHSSNAHISDEQNSTVNDNEMDLETPTSHDINHPSDTHSNNDTTDHIEGNIFINELSI